MKISKIEVKRRRGELDIKVYREGGDHLCSLWTGEGRVFTDIAMGVYKHLNRSCLQHSFNRLCEISEIAPDSPVSVNLEKIKTILTAWEALILKLEDDEIVKVYETPVDIQDL